jgi:hypothetical protein
VHRLRVIVAIAVLAAVASGCGSATGDSGSPPLPSSITHQKAGTPFPIEPCGSWISPGIVAAYCDDGQEAPSGFEPSAISFGGTDRSGSEGGIAQASGVLPEGGVVTIKASGTADGTLIAQGLCGNVLARARFDVHFDKGDRATLRITRSGDTPVILLVRDGTDVAPNHELLVDLDWMKDAPDGCAFRVA